MGRRSRLGHGDTTSFVNPKLVEALKDDVIFELSCGCWHTVAVVLIPPLLKGGLVRARAVYSVICVSCQHGASEELRTSYSFV